MELPQTTKPVSRTVSRNFGIPLKPTFAEDLDDLRSNPPYIVVAEAIRNIPYIINGEYRHLLKKKNRYVMSLGIFNQLSQVNNKKCLVPSAIKFKNIYRPYQGQPLDNKTLLIWRTGGIGDLCFIQPHIRFLKEKYPTCKIWFACGVQYQPMVNNWECIDRLEDLPFSASMLFQADYHAIFEGVIERCKEAIHINAYELFAKWLNINTVDLYPILTIKPELVESCKDILEEWKMKEKDFIILQMRASSPVRTPSSEVWRKIINILTLRGHNIVLTDSPRQEENIDKFINNSDLAKKDMVFNFSKYSKTLDYSIAMTSLSKLSVSTDSALLHISAGVGTPCFGLYGPFNGELRLSTYEKADWINCVASCAPCFLHGSHPCSNSDENGHSLCFENLDINQLVYKVEKLIGKDS